MNFTQKLIDDTKNGTWDFYWKLNEGTKTYSFTKPKHFLSGLNFSLEKDKSLIVFPNGYGLKTGLLSLLEEAVLESMERTVDTSIQMYVSGEELTPDQEAEQEAQDENKQSGASLLKNSEKETRKVKNSKI
jgi:hypothetical protein